GAARSEQGGFSCGMHQEADLIHHSSIHHISLRMYAEFPFLLSLFKIIADVLKILTHIPESSSAQSHALFVDPSTIALIWAVGISRGKNRCQRW
nr:hypothetical protein [Tanacetum cinerariifolium]